MPSLFSELETLASAAVDTVMGELIRIDPMKKGEVFASSVDGARQQVTVTAVVDFNPVAVTVQDEGSYDGFQPQLAGDRIHVSIALSSFQGSSQYPQANDVIVALERPGMPKFRLTRAPDHDGIGRMVCPCVPA
jgi:hypothetical protein